MRKRSQAIIAAMLALGMAVGMCGCEGQLRPRSHHPAGCAELERQAGAKRSARGFSKTLDQCNQNRDTDTLPTILEVRNWTSAPAS